MGILKIGPNLYLIKARAKKQTHTGLEDRRRQERFKGTKPQAEERYLSIKAELRGIRREARTFADLLAMYLASRGVIKDSQKSVYDTLLRDLGMTPIPQLEDALRRYFIILRATPSKWTGRKPSPAALNRPRTMVSAVLNLALKTKAIGENPLDVAIWPKAKEIPRDRFLHEVEAIRLLNVLEANAPHLYPMVRFALLVPCRKSELINMVQEDLDLFHNAIRVHNGTTKNEEGSWKPIPPSMLEYFRSIPAGSRYLFFKEVNGQYRRLGDFKRSWTRCLLIAGIQNFHFHDTRHISATNLVDAGTPERVVMAVAGWRTNMLSTYYNGSSRRALEFVKFPSGGTTLETVSEGEQGKSGQNRAEKAVS